MDNVGGIAPAQIGVTPITVSMPTQWPISKLSAEPRTKAGIGVLLACLVALISLGSGAVLAN